MVLDCSRRLCATQGETALVAEDGAGDSVGHEVQAELIGVATTVDVDRLGMVLVDAGEVDKTDALLLELAPVAQEQRIADLDALAIGMLRPDRPFFSSAPIGFEPGKYWFGWRK